MTAERLAASLSRSPPWPPPRLPPAPIFSRPPFMARIRRLRPAAWSGPITAWSSPTSGPARRAWPMSERKRRGPRPIISSQAAACDLSEHRQQDAKAEIGEGCVLVQGLREIAGTKRYRRRDHRHGGPLALPDGHRRGGKRASMSMSKSPWAAILARPLICMTRSKHRENPSGGLAGLQRRGLAQVGRIDQGRRHRHSGLGARLLLPQLSSGPGRMDFGPIISPKPGARRRTWIGTSGNCPFTTKWTSARIPISAGANTIPIAPALWAIWCRTAFCL